MCGICNDIMLLLRHYVLIAAPSLGTGLDLILMQNCACRICTKSPLNSKAAFVWSDRDQI